MLISVSFSHKNIYLEKFADFDLEKKEKDNFLRANNDKIKINICVADFCSYCFNITFIKTAAYPRMLLFIISAPQKAPLPTEFPFSFDLVIR